MSQSAKRTPSQGTPQTAPRQGWARAAGEGVLKEASGAFARAGFKDATLLVRWPEIVGPQIARIARPMNWQDGPEGAILTLRCESGAAVLLQHQTRTLIEKLNTYLGAGRIARLKLVPGALPEAPEPPKHPAPEADFTSERVPLPDALNRLERLRSRLKRPCSERPD
jgi:hypothetical protein